jgi:succinate dehydrogenase / fumarate reductase cytochrome b subunit
LIYAFEAFLFVIFIFHMVSAMTVAWTDKRKGRETGYKYAKDAGGKSRKTFASKTMVYSGPIILLFVIGHIFLFKFNGGNPHETDAAGVKDLYKVVVLAFKGPGFAIFTVVSMILLGLHLRHGFWSAFQSLGWANDKYLPLLVNVARVFAIVLAIGFIIIPVYLYLSGDPNALQTTSGGH